MVNNLVTVRGVAIDHVQSAQPGPVLEPGAGIGQIALSLAAHGIHVDGVDLSSAMVDQRRAKPGGNRLIFRHIKSPLVVPDHKGG